MLTLPPEIMTVLMPFMQLFSSRVWDWAQILVVGAILAPGKRTVTSILHVMGLKDEAQFQNYHRVLNRARWSSFAVSRILLNLLVSAFYGSDEPIVLAGDGTLERRWGPKIAARSIFRDSTRSSRRYPNFAPGLRWLSIAALIKLPWSVQTWALPFLTILAPSKKTNAAHGRRHKTIVQLLGQAVAVLRRWLPERDIVLVTDGALGGVRLGWRCRRLGVTLVTRLNWRAALHEPPGPRPPGKPGPHATKGARLPKLKELLANSNTLWRRSQLAWYGRDQQEVDIAMGTALWYTPGQKPLPIRWVLVRDPAGKQQPAAFMATDQALTAEEIVCYYIRRWAIEVTFQECRAHLGVETQRQWSDLAIVRTTPALLGLFSLITLLAHRLTACKDFPVRSTAWYRKPQPTFADAIALVRRYLWTNMEFNNPHVKPILVEFPAPVLHGLVDTICYAT